MGRGIALRPGGQWFDRHHGYYRTLQIVIAKVSGLTQTYECNRCCGAGCAWVNTQAAAATLAVFSQKEAQPMKKCFIITLVIMALFFSAGQALAINPSPLDYRVSSTNVLLDENGNGSFTITVQDFQQPFVGMQFVVVPSADVEIVSVSYNTNVSHPATYGPRAIEEGSNRQGMVFAFLNINLDEEPDEDKSKADIFSGAVTCTVHVRYVGDKDGTGSLVIDEITAQRFETGTIYMSTQKTPITLILDDYQPDPDTYIISVESVSGGTITVAPSSGRAKEGETVTLSFIANSGFKFDAWKVTGDVSKQDVTVTNNKFTMPAENVTVTAKCSSTGGGSGGGGGGSDEPETPGDTASTVSGNTISVPVSPVIDGSTAVVTPTDLQISSALQMKKSDQENIVSFEVIAADAGTAHEFTLELSQSQSNLLAEGVEKVAFRTPVGTVIMPKEVLEQANGGLKLTISKVSGETDTFEVTLQDEKGIITRLNGRTALEFPVTRPGSPTDVMTHNGEIMKNSVISGSKGYAVTTGFSKFAVISNQVSFTDTADHWGKQYIAFLAARNIINGIAPNKFAPNNYVTRAEFIKMLINSIDGLDVKNAAPAGFNDVKEGQWYSDFINWAAGKKIVSGYEDGSFGISKRITRQEMAVIIDRFAAEMAIDLDPTQAHAAFVDDSKIAPFAKDSVYKIQQVGIITGKGNNTFDPAGNATRAEAAKMISGLVELLVK
ncbi:MAG: S-layer homology domain-containing protein [Dehalobacterium sp.]